MSTIDKLIFRLLSKPKDFSYNELHSLLTSLGYREMQGAGSRVCFTSGAHKIKLHKPYPDNILKRYQIDFIIEALTTNGLIFKNKTDE